MAMHWWKGAERQPGHGGWESSRQLLGGRHEVESAIAGSSCHYNLGSYQIRPTFSASPRDSYCCFRSADRARQAAPAAEAISRDVTVTSGRACMGEHVALNAVRPGPQRPAELLLGQLCKPLASLELHQASLALSAASQPNLPGNPPSLPAGSLGGSPSRTADMLQWAAWAHPSPWAFGCTGLQKDWLR